ncbi:phosphatase PAP2 family protein [Roseomonas sp. E05]|uniref:phosphatase PAP2 family protein n=1 Tax=Roseomonas sp. E05 TaxID=3046310 RepID=UPI0024B8A9CF|nr:phosphatase PAP2 family protein [Roseomonas sp. E05]MDJ0387721.1 phosphatase PAP2 family protein [Roseomonas sp. E05]
MAATLCWRIMQFLTDFADQAVILPATLALMLTLMATAWRRGALCWGLVVASTLGLMLALKLAAHAFPAFFGPWDLRSPSGHVAAAAILYGGLAVLLLERRALALLVAGGVALLIAATRLLLRYHNLPEVVVGGVVGLAGVVVLLRLTPPVPRTVSRFALAMTVLVVVGLMHGERLGAERAIQHTAQRLVRLL